MSEPITEAQQKADELHQCFKWLGEVSAAAYEQSPFSALSRDYFSRFWRDPDVIAGDGDVEITSEWKILLPENAPELSRLMAAHLRDFLARKMDVDIEVQVHSSAADTEGAEQAILLLREGGGDAALPDSFTIAVRPDRVVVTGQNTAGLRDGVVKLVDLIGLRRAPVLTPGETTYRPRLPVRLGTTPWLGTARDAVFFGYNARWAINGNLFEFSDSTAIPELQRFQKPELQPKMAEDVAQAQQYQMRTYSLVTTPKFAADDPVFLANPELRGALTWKEDGLHVLCTEHPLVQRYLEESVASLFRAAPGLNGMIAIIGGEGFYHCFMRPFGVEKGHTNCPRCEALGPEQVVSNLINRMARAARSVQPDAEVVAWPYSAIHVWSNDPAEVPFIQKLEPGAALFTEMEKDEYVTTPEGVRKHLWDYSIHLIGPCERTRRQIEAALQVGVPVYVKSEPELSFEAPRLPHVPCLDLWAQRAEAMASCGASGAWVFPAFRPFYGTSAAEVYKYFFWEPLASQEEILNRLAARIAGQHAAPALRRAWQLVSQSIEHAPELPPYYTGPYYIGPCHPMCADPNATLPQVFYGRYLFWAEMKPEDGLALNPTFITSPRGDVPVFLQAYRNMEVLLRGASEAIDAVTAQVPEACRLAFEAEASPLHWFYRTVRTHANFYESCQLRDRLLQPQEGRASNSETDDQLWERWREVLLDEQENTRAALPLAEADVRLDCYYGGDHNFSHSADMIRAKLEIIEREIEEFLPAVRERFLDGRH